MYNGYYKTFYVILNKVELGLTSWRVDTGICQPYKFCETSRTSTLNSCRCRDTKQRERGRGRESGIKLSYLQFDETSVISRFRPVPFRLTMSIESWLQNSRLQSWIQIQINSSKRNTNHMYIFLTAKIIQEIIFFNVRNIFWKLSVSCNMF